MNETATELGYLFLGGVFVFAGIDHFRRFAAVKAMLVARNWPAPGPLLALASALQIVAGLCVITGVGRPLAALALAVFTIAATVTLLDFWHFAGPPREGMRSGFIVNFAVLGGLLLAFGQSL